MGSEGWRGWGGGGRRWGGGWVVRGGVGGRSWMERRIDSEGWDGGWRG